MSIKSRLQTIQNQLPQGVTLVAVSKTHPAGDIREAYDAGQRIFGESRPQELCAKQQELPGDIQWHMIGHLQTNKVRMIAPFVAMIQSVDSERLLRVIDAEAVRCGRVIDVLLELHIAGEQTKTGWPAAELESFLASGEWKGMKGVCIRGLMAIATNTDDEKQVKQDFLTLHNLMERYRGSFFAAYPRFDTLSMGMTSDYRLAVECHSTMVRIGSLIFGER